MLNSTYTFSISSGSLPVLPIIVCPMLYRFHAGQQRSSSFQVSAFTVPVNSRLQKVYKTLGKATHFFFFTLLTTTEVWLDDGCLVLSKFCVCERLTPSSCGEEMLSFTQKTFQPRGGTAAA